MDEEANLRDVLRTLSPSARDDLRCILIHNQPDRDAISSRLMRYRDQNGQDWADIIDFLTLYPKARRRVARLLAEIGATSAR
jgi:cytochrome oxidase Cu insertion factor (SCO1/SenC/PrrC family)